MTSIETRTPRHRSQRLRISLAVICGLGCAVSASTGAAALAAGSTAHGAATFGTWTPVQAPVPATARMDPSVAVRQLTCADGGVCVGVGSFTNQAGNRRGLIEQLSHGNWMGSQAPLPVGAPVNAQVVLSSVSCPSTTSCGVSGYFDTPTQRHPLALALSRGMWQVQGVPAVPGTQPRSSTTLSSISCPLTGTCDMVGRYEDAHGHYQGLIETLSKSTWHALSAPLPADASPDPAATLEWVTCPAPGDCTAVGAYVDKRGARELTIDSLAGRKWTASKVPMPRDAAGDPVAYLGYVTCLGLGDCLAVGNYVTSLGAHEGLFEQEKSGIWHARQAPLPANADPEDPQATINEAACPSNRFCAATGAYADPNGDNRAVIETLAHGVWKAIKAPAPATDFTGRYLSSVACATAHFCVAGGSTDVTGLLDMYYRGKWSFTVAPLPNPGFHALFRANSVSCPDYGACAAFGSYTRTGGMATQGQGLLETLSAR